MPHEEGGFLGCRVTDEPLCLRQEFAIDGALAFAAERSTVLDPLTAVRVGPAVHNTALAEAELLDDLRVGGKVVLLGILTRVEVIQDPEELVEAVHGRQVFVAVAKVILAELSGRVAQWFEHLGQRRIPEKVVPALGEWAPGLDLHAALAHQLLLGVTLEERVALDLVDHRRDLVVRDEINKPVGIEVRDTDRPRESLAVQLLHRPPSAVHLLGHGVRIDVLLVRGDAGERGACHVYRWGFGDLE